MNDAWAFVAAPTSRISRPVANGSSVPAWPTFCFSPVWSRNSRRTTATTSCDVMPAGLLNRITPGSITSAAGYYRNRIGGGSGGSGRSELLGYAGADLVDQLAERDL